MKAQGGGGGLCGGDGAGAVSLTGDTGEAGPTDEDVEKWHATCTPAPAGSKRALRRSAPALRE